MTVKILLTRGKSALVEAAKAYDRAAAAAFGDFAVLNFPNPVSLSSGDTK